MRKLPFILLSGCCAALLLCVPWAATTTASRKSPAASSMRLALDERDQRQPFVLELPDLGGQLITAPEAAIPTANLHSIRLHLRQPFAARINYGKVYTKINGESAGPIQSSTASSNGNIFTCDLDRYPRFRLRPGKNVIEISATANDGQTFYASYVLLAGGRPTAASGSGGTSLAATATIESVPLATGADREPPSVHLISPNSALRLTAAGGTFKVSGLVSDNSGSVASVEINGQAAKLSPAAATRGLLLDLNARKSGAGGGAAAGARVAAFEFERMLTLGADAASLIVEAKDGAGNVSRVSVPVRRRVAATSSEFKGRKFALVVGVSRYKYAEGGLQNLNYADADARAVRDFLQRREGGGFDPANISLLENEQATLEGVRAELARFLPLAGPNDLLFIFIAAHGGPDLYARQDLYFWLHDTRLSDMPRTGLRMTELKDTLDGRVRAGRVVAFIDTCYSGGLSGDPLVATRGLENNLSNLYATKLFAEEGRAVLTASDVNEMSQESKRWGGGHGIFTWALLEGLSGSANLNGDRFITAGELFAYVHDRVRLETGFRQNPRSLSGNNEDLTLAVAPAKQ
jgi:hypothetical protein